MKNINGIICIVLAALCWSLCGVFLKFIECNSFIINGARSWIGFFAMIILARKKPVFFIRNEEGKISKKDTFYLWMGGISFAITAITFVAANKTTTAANAIFLQYTNPVWVIILGPLILGEKNAKFDFLCLAGIFLGMTLFFADELRAGFSNMDKTTLLGDITAVVSGFFLCLTTIFMRKQKSGKSIESFMLSQLIVGTIFTPFFFIYALPDLNSWIFMILLGVISGALPGIFYPMGLRTVSALSASLIAMMEPVISPLLVLIFYGEKPTLLCILGGILIICFIVLREILLHKIPAAQKNETNQNSEKIESLQEE